jgi:hypothetical protein
MLKGRFADILYEKAERKNYGRGTIICKSFEEFDEAILGIDCALVSPGGTGLPYSYLEQLEKDGLIRVFRVWGDDNVFDHVPPMLRFFYPSKAVFVFIPEDDVKRFK